MNASARMLTHSPRVKLFKPVTPIQLEKILANNCEGFGCSFEGERFFYPKLHHHYAEQIARNSYGSRYGAGYVVEFEVDADYISRFPLQTIGYDEQQEYCVDINRLPELNQHIHGKIEITTCNTPVSPAITMVS
jgi:hypothetical protein